MNFQSFTRFTTNRSLEALFTWVNDIAFRPFPLVEFEDEVPNANFWRAAQELAIRRPEEARRRWGKWRQSTSRAARTRRWPRLGPRWSMEPQPRAGQSEWRETRSALCIDTGAQGRAAARWGAQLGHGGHVQDTHHPMRQNSEQVAGVGVDMVGSKFGPSRVRIGLWA